MKTLVIHPEDYTTRFLAKVYEGKDDWTVITTKVSRKILKAEMKAHDRIIMLGHGVPYGLIGFNTIFIDSKLVYLLRDKLCVCVWCNADKFVEQYKLKGFYTGMIISEDYEAEMFKVDVDEEELLKSNWDFAYALQAGVDSDDMLEVVKSKYVGDTPIYNFNKQRVYSNV